MGLLRDVSARLEHTIETLHTMRSEVTRLQSEVSDANDDVRRRDARLAEKADGVSQAAAAYRTAAQVLESDLTSGAVATQEVGKTARGAIETAAESLKRSVDANADSLLNLQTTATQGTTALQEEGQATQGRVDLATTSLDGFDTEVQTQRTAIGLALDAIDQVLGRVDTQLTERIDRLNAGFTAFNAQLQEDAQARVPQAVDQFVALARDALSPIIQEALLATQAALEAAGEHYRTVGLEREQRFEDTATAHFEALHQHLNESLQRVQSVLDTEARPAVETAMPIVSKLSLATQTAVNIAIDMHPSLPAVEALHAALKNFNTDMLSGATL